MKKFWFLAILVLPFLLSGCLFDLSPDGKWIVVEPLALYGQRPPEISPMLLVPTDGGATQIVPHSEDGVFPVWSPDGNFIAFRKDNFKKNLEANKEIWLFDVQAKTTKQLPGEFSNAVKFFWRGDSQRLLIYSWPEKGPQSLLWFDLATQKIARRWRLRNEQSTAEEQPAQFLTDSDEVALLVSQAGKTNLFVTTSAGLKALTTTGDVAAFGVAEKRLFWLRLPNSKDSRSAQLFSCDFDGKNVARLPFASHWPAPDPERGWHSQPRFTFSPDTHQIAVTDTFPVLPATKGKPPQQFTACYLMNQDGTNSRLLFRAAPRNTPSPSEKEWEYSTVLFPQWSHDGRRLALLVHDFKTADQLQIFDGDGSNSRRLSISADAGKTLPP